MDRKKITLIFLAILSIMVFTGWQIVQSQSVVKSLGDRLGTIVSDAIGTRVEIGTVRVKSFYELEVKDIIVYDKQAEQAIHAAEARVTLRLLSVFLDPVAAINEVQLKGLKARLEERADGKWNYEDWVQDTDEPNSFRGEIYLDKAAVTVVRQGKELLASDITGIVDLENFSKDNSVDLDLTFNAVDTEIAIMGMVGEAKQDLKLKAEKLDVEKLIALWGEDNLPADIKLNNLAVDSVEGRFINDKGSLQYSGQLVGMTGRLTVMDTAIAIDRGLITFDEQTVSLNMSLTANNEKADVFGAVHLSGQEPSLDLEVKVNDFVIENILTDIPFKGRISTTAKVKGSFDRPSVTGNFTVRDGEIYGVSFSEGKTQASYDVQGVALEDLELRTLGGTLAGEGVFLPADSSYKAYLKASDIDIPSLIATLNANGIGGDGVTGVTGRLATEFTLAGVGSDMNKVIVVGEAEVQQAGYQNLPIDRANASFMVEGKDIIIDFLSLKLPNDSDVGVEGRIMQGESLDLKFYAGHLDLSLARYLSNKLDFAGLADIKGEVHGDISDPQVSFAFSAINGRLMHQPFDSVMFRGEGNLSKVGIRDFSMEKNGKIVWLVNGNVGLTGRKEIDVTIDTIGARMEDITALVAPEEPLTGNVDNIIRFTGTLDDPEAVGYIHFYRGSYYGVLLSGMDGDYFLENGVLRLQDFHIFSPLIDMVVNGYIYTDGRLDMTAVVRDVNMKRFASHFPYEVSGNGVFNGSITGTINKPIFAGNLQAPRVVMNGIELTDVGGDVIYAESRVSLNNVGFRQNGERVGLSLTLDTNTRALNGKMLIDNADIAAILALANQRTDKVTGSFKSQINFGGTLDTPRISLIGHIPRGDIVGYDVHDVSIGLQLANNVLDIETLSGYQGAGTFGATGKVHLNGYRQIDLTAKGIALGMFANIIGIKESITGEADISGKFFGTPDSPAFDLKVQARNGGIVGSSFDELTGELRLFNERIMLDKLIVSKQVGVENYSASAKGVIPLRAVGAKKGERVGVSEEINLVLTLDKADLQLLPVLSKQIEWATGRTDGNITVLGTVEEPRFKGKLTLLDGAMKIKGIVQPLTEMNADISLGDGAVIIRDFSGKMGSGLYALTGQFGLEGIKPHSYNLSLIMNSLDVGTDFFRGPITGAFTLTEGREFNERLPKLAGNITLDNAMVSIPTIPDTDTELPNMLLDVTVKVGNRLHFYSPNFYNLYPIGTVHFGGTLNNPQPSGQISIKRGGTISYLRTPFKIREGIASFDRMGTFMPSISFSADARLVDTKIFIKADGPLEHMDFKLSSSPEMSETEIISLLTLRNAYRSGDEKISASDILALGLQMSVLSELESFMRDILFLDTLTVNRGNGSLLEPTKLDSLTGDEYNLELGKYINDKLMLRYVQGIGTSDTRRVGIQYELSDRYGISYDNEKGNHIFGFEVKIKF